MFVSSREVGSSTHDWRVVAETWACLPDDCPVLLGYEAIGLAYLVASDCDQSWTFWAWLVFHPLISACQSLWYVHYKLPFCTSVLTFLFLNWWSSRDTPGTAYKGLWNKLYQKQFTEHIQHKWSQFVFALRPWVQWIP